MTTATIKKETGVLDALVSVSGATAAKVSVALIENGFRSTRASDAETIQAAAKAVGLKLKEVSPEKLFSDEDGETKRLTLNNVLDIFTEGTYLVLVRGHVLVIRDGRVADPVNGGRGGRRRVMGMYDVVNATQSEDGSRLIFTGVPKGREGPTLQRRKEAFDFVKTYIETKKGHKPAVEKVIEETSYTPRDLERDLRMGLVELV